MIEADSNHCEILRKSLSGERAVDEQAFGSLAILSERLERLKKVGEIFDNVAFSPAVERLRGREKAVVIG